MTRLRDAVLSAWPEIDSCTHIPSEVKAAIGDALCEDPRPYTVIKDRDQDGSGRTVPPIISGDSRGVLVTSADGHVVALGPETARQIGREVAKEPRILTRVGGGR